MNDQLGGVSAARTVKLQATARIAFFLICRTRFYQEPLGLRPMPGSMALLSLKMQQKSFISLHAHFTF